MPRSESTKLGARDRKSAAPCPRPFGYKCRRTCETDQRLKSAVEWRLAIVLPAIKWLKVPQHELDFLTFDEADRLIDCAPNDWRPMITVAAGPMWI
jgi:hypothetical protein